jgi:hypothetical protein
MGEIHEYGVELHLSGRACQGKNSPQMPLILFGVVVMQTAEDGVIGDGSPVREGDTASFEEGLDRWLPHEAQKIRHDREKAQDEAGFFGMEGSGAE